ncbi:MAG TPA: hypothetical protein VK427_01050, partial [Kofleriaceae bacterium]|nr:hypothetical protein [Kofleriaceae bacterium]
MSTYTPLEPARLSPAAQKALGPGPGRMMASRGMLPLAPADQLTVLYQLGLDGDASLAETARKTATSLPEKLLAGTLADASLDPRVLDLFATLHADKPAIFDALVQNASIADATVATLANKADSRGVDMIATNEQRLLRHPEIIAGMYMNRRARMSTIDRVVELAVRNHVRVPGIAAWEEVARALTGGSSGTDDATFAAAAERAAIDDSKLTTGDADHVPDEDLPEPAEPVEETQIRLLSIPAKIRLAQLGNAFQRSELIRDPMKIVAVATIKSPAVSEIEAARYARNQTLADDVIRYIAQKREWTKLYGVKLSLCKNPKTPIPEATKFLPFLREK